MKPILAAGVVVAVSLLVIGCGAEIAILPTPTIAASTKTPWPGFGPDATLPPPPTPVTVTAQLSKDAALTMFMAKYPAVQADLAAGKLLTVTATLATHGNRGWPGASLLYDPALPVWIITIRFPPRTQWFGPAGQEAPFTFDAEGHEMSALDGRILGSWLIASGGK